MSFGKILMPARCHAMQPALHTSASEAQIAKMVQSEPDIQLQLQASEQLACILKARGQGYEPA